MGADNWHVFGTCWYCSWSSISLEKNCPTVWKNLLPYNLFLLSYSSKSRNTISWFNFNPKATLIFTITNKISCKGYEFSFFCWYLFLVAKELCIDLCSRNYSWHGKNQTGNAIELSSNRHTARRAARFWWKVFVRGAAELLIKKSNYPRLNYYTLRRIRERNMLYYFTYQEPLMIRLRLSLHWTINKE